MVDKWKWPVIKAVSLALFGPAILGGIVMAAGVGAAKLVGKLFDVFSSKITATPNKGIQKALSSKLGESIAKSASDTSKTIESSPKLNSSSIKGFFGNMAQIAGGILVSGVAMAGAIWAVNKIIGGMSEMEIIKSLGIVTASAIAMIPMAVAMKLLSAVNVASVPWAQLAVGVVALGAVSAAMVLGVKGLIKLSSGITKNDVEILGMSISTIGKAFLIAGGVILGSAGLGAVLIAPGLNLAFAASAAAGLSALSAIVAALAKASFEIADELKDKNLGSDFKQKIEAFAPIMNAVGNFAKIAVDAMKASAPSFSGLLDKLKGDTKESPVIKGINKVQEFIRELIPSITMMALSLKNIFTTGDKPELFSSGASALAGIMTSVLEVANSLKPPADWKSGGLFGGSDADLKEFSEHVKRQLDIIVGDNGLIKKITNLLTDGTITELNIEKTAALGNFISSIVQSTQTLASIKDTATIKNTLSRMDLDVISPLSDVLSAFSQKTQQWELNLAIINDSFVNKVGTGAKAMVTEVNMIAAEIAKIDAIDVTTSLKSISDKLGLTGNEQIRLAKRDLNLIVNANIKIDAVELEKVLLDRPGSRFAKTRG
jgi:hypothetical protein